MTTLRKLIENIDFNNKKLESVPNFERLASILDIDNFYWSNDTRLKSYFIKVHRCTDSHVGIKAYFLDNEFVAISNQVGRKCDEDFSFVSKEHADKVRNYILSLVEADYAPEYDIIEDLDDEIVDTYKINYNTQILHKSAFLNGEKVKIIQTNFESEGIHSPNYFHSVLIKINGNNQIVDCRDLDFEYNSLE